jgi:hypothetical protein
MRSTVVILKERGGYTVQASGKFGGGYDGVWAGDTPDEAASVAAHEMMRYAQSNKEGGDLVAPAEVMQRVPEHLRSVAVKEKMEFR